MIKKVLEVRKNINYDDVVELSWFDLHGSGLSQVSQNQVEFVAKDIAHLHSGDVLVCEDGYKILIERAKDEIYELEFEDMLEFAKVAYEVGNRHQPIMLEFGKIIILNSVSLRDIVYKCTHNPQINVKKIVGYFKPNGKSTHSH